nr:zinc finger, CCHC-type [Tanacetum cinerariifolium]
QLTALVEYPKEIEFATIGGPISVDDDIIQKPLSPSTSTQEYNACSNRYDINPTCYNNDNNTDIKFPDNLVSYSEDELWNMVESPRPTSLDHDRHDVKYESWKLSGHETMEGVECKKLGNLKRDYRGTSTTQEQSNLILEDEEPSLLLTTHEEVLLNEGQIQPRKYTSGDASMWYLDNGASNQMTGVKSHFKDIDESVSRRVRFGDGSYVQIKGRGFVLLGCKNQEQKIVSDVYYIPNLKRNILSLGQLTKIGCKVIMDGNKLTLYDKNKWLLMKVERSKNRLYSIKLQIEAPICLLANVDNQAWLWHARLGHLNFDDINKMTRKNLVEGIPRINHAGQICDAYGEDTSTQDTFRASFVTEGVDTENTTPVNTEINDNIDDMYQEPDPINDPNLPITPPTYTYNPHSKEEEEATTSSTKNSGNGFDDTLIRGFKDLNEIHESTQEVEIGNLLLIEEEPRNYKEASTDKK